jgi:hypothetical protein
VVPSKPFTENSSSAAASIFSRAPGRARPAAGSRPDAGERSFRDDFPLLDDWFPAFIPQRVYTLD